MSLTSDIIRDRISADVDPADLDLAAGLIEDAVPAGASLSAIEGAIAHAKQAYGRSLFSVTPVAQATTPPTSPPAATEAPNPFAQATWNLTKQTLLQRDNPARAAQLKAQAAK